MSISEPTPPRRPEAGFTIIEVLVSVMILSVGILALVGSSASTTRSIGEAGRATVAAQVAAEQMEFLRNTANRTKPACQHASFASSGSPQVRQGMAVAWTVAGTGTIRTVTVNVTYRSGARVRTDVMSTVISCG